MTEVSATTSQVATASTTSTTSTSTSSAITSDFDTFLTMLTAQIQNQDPLNPMDSTEFAVQLATFSGVEQQVKTNDLLEALTSQNQATTMAQMAEWVGTEVRVAAPVDFDGTPVTLSTQSLSYAHRAQLVVRDESGVEKAREQITVGQDQFDWSGVDGAGSPLSDGVYSFEVESLDSSGQVIDVSVPQIYAEVTEARTDSGNVALVLKGGTTVEAGAVTAVRAPQQY